MQRIKLNESFRIKREAINSKRISQYIVQYIVVGLFCSFVFIKHFLLWEMVVKVISFQRPSSETALSIQLIIIIF